MEKRLPFQITVTRNRGRTLGMADSFSRHPSPSNVKNQLVAEELWNDWFTVNEIKFKKPVLDEQSRRGVENQPITGGLAESSELKEKSGVASEKVASKQNKLTVKSIIE